MIIYPNRPLTISQAYMEWRVSLVLRRRWKAPIIFNRLVLITTLTRPYLTRYDYCDPRRNSTPSLVLPNPIQAACRLCPIGLNSKGLGVTLFNLHHIDETGFEMLTISVGSGFKG